MAGVSCNEVTKRFGATVALDRVSLDVPAGEILALVGPSGCGKTTLLRVIAGFERPDAGRVEIAGREVAGPRTSVAPEERRAGFVFQDYALFPHLSVADNIGFGVPRAERPARIEEMLELVGLAGLGERYPNELSGGQQQRVAIARALAPRPEVLLLDEPFSNLDADLRVRVRGEVGDIVRRSGATTLFVTHDQQEAFDIADRIAVMHRGAIEQVGRAEEVYHLPRTRFVADFVGEAVFLPVTVGATDISSELGPLPLDAATLEPGPAEIMLRPEDIIVTQGSSTSGTVVAGRRFRGPTVLTTLRLPSGRTVTAAHSSQHVFAAGDPVEVRMDVDHLVVFRGEEVIARIPVRQATGTDARIGGEPPNG